MSISSPAYPLLLERTLAAPRAAVWRCWTEPELLCQWFCPKPWGVSHAELELFPGGRFFTHMVGPNGEQVPNPGVFLKVDAGRQLVFTDAFVSAWVPSAKPFMVGDITFADSADGGPHYIARALHWTESDQKRTRRWAFMKGGMQLPSSSMPLPPRCEYFYFSGPGVLGRHRRGRRCVLCQLPEVF
ncbi:MAG: SRPBCC domain-containing protein [Rhodoferax sp.]|uniref:SRPBCC domain-containing protein n=1 Tax=Rhodoferax sp. TaxID=50421 RepID=UPI002ACD39F6|nr:SRPBCC domain-containing protein [Rhodoferax sp.]MDZ7892123.1 SRPBCC domain-containing protein [Rhodoferax sp.]